MTKDEIMQMEAGREMDELIATEVMGWAIGDRGAHYVYNDGVNVHFVIAGEFEPSTDISAAWQVMEWMRDNTIEKYTAPSLFSVPAGWSMVL